MHFRTGLRKCDSAEEEIWISVTNFKEFSIYRESRKQVENSLAKYTITGATRFTSYCIELKICFLLNLIVFKYQGSLLVLQLNGKLLFRAVWHNENRILTCAEFQLRLRQKSHVSNSHHIMMLNLRKYCQIYESFTPFWLFVFFMSNICVDWISTLGLTTLQGTPYSKKVWFLKFKFL